MYLKTYVLLFFFFSSSNIFSQVDFIDNLTNWMANWETTYKPSSEVTCKEDLNIDWAYHNHYIKLDILGGWMEHPNSKYYTTEYITFNKDGQIAGFYMDDAGYDQLASISGRIDDNKLIFKLTSQSETYEETWEYKDGNLVRIHQGKDKKTGKDFKIEALFKKK